MNVHICTFVLVHIINIISLLTYIVHQLKSTIFDHFQLAVNNFIHVFGIRISCTIVILTVQQILL